MTFVTTDNTCISTFYALGRRVTVNHRKRYVPVFLGLCVVGYLFSLFGFDTLSAYPIIGYVGMVLAVVMFIWRTATVRPSAPRPGAATASARS
ncbi:hypothetical protein QJS66_16835 [Kocuria rhizophila]|nr:hypothetical protein QJS66_16835 [Kocuria rhizophila]